MLIVIATGRCQAGFDPDVNHRPATGAAGLRRAIHTERQTREYARSMIRFLTDKNYRQALKLERKMMLMERAFEKGQYGILRRGIEHQEHVLRWFNLEGDWSEERLYEFLSSRGMIRSINDEDYVDRMWEAACGF